MIQQFKKWLLVLYHLYVPHKMRVEPTIGSLYDTIKKQHNHYLTKDTAAYRLSNQGVLYTNSSEDLLLMVKSCAANLKNGSVFVANTDWFKASPRTIDLDEYFLYRGSREIMSFSVFFSELVKNIEVIETHYTKLSTANRQYYDRQLRAVVQDLYQVVSILEKG